MEYPEQIVDMTLRSSLLRAPGPDTDLPFCIRTLGCTENQSAHISKGTYFEDVMLTWFPGGKGFFYYGQRQLTVISGMVGLVLPEESESILKADADDPYTHYYCRFAGGEAIKMARYIRAKFPTPFFHHSLSLEIGKILEDMFESNTLSDPQKTANYLKPIEAKLALILSMLCDEPSHRPKKNTGLNLSRLSEYILQQLSEPVSLEQAAEHFRVSKSYFCRECNRLLGGTYQKVLEREKMILAVSLLRDGMLDLTVAEVAYKVGYSDPLYFSKVFKRIHGVSPSRLRGSLQHP